PRYARGADLRRRGPLRSRQQLPASRRVRGRVRRPRRCRRAPLGTNLLDRLTVVLAVALVLGAIVGVTLGALGAGGSILAVPVLVHVAGVPVSGAAATALVALGAAAAMGAPGRRRNVDWRVAAWFVASGALAALAGAVLGRRIPDDALLLGFSALVLV